MPVLLRLWPEVRSFASKIGKFKTDKPIGDLCVVPVNALPDDGLYNYLVALDVNHVARF